MNKKISEDVANTYKNTPCEDLRNFFIMRKVRLLHRCSECKDFISIGFVTNINEQDYVQGEILGSLSFGVIVDEVMVTCSSFSLGIGIVSLLI